MSGSGTKISAALDAGTLLSNDMVPLARSGNTSAFHATIAEISSYVSATITTGVSSFNTRTGPVTLQTADITAAYGAPIASPAFTGVPTAPTALAGTSTGQLATTQFVTNAVTGATAGVASWNTRTGAVVMTLSDVTNVGGAPLASPALSGTPTAPTQPPATNNTSIATTGFVAASYAPLASPALSGTPTAPTVTPATDSTTKLATTGFVQSAIGAISAGVTSWNTRSGAVTLLAADVTGVGGALLASPAFTGTPTVPTAAAGTNTTQAASTAYVTAAIAADPALNDTGRNRLHNVGFTINQRNYTSGTALAAAAYGLDRWKAGASGCTYTFTQSPPFTTITITAGSLQQVVEAAGVEGGTYTLSWTGTAQGRVNAGTYAVSPVTVTGLAANTAITVEFNAGTLSRAQLEPGSVVTLLDRGGTPQQQLAACQRYFQIGFASCYAYSTAGNNIGVTQLYPVVMRANPTVAYSGPGYANASGVTAQFSGAGYLGTSATVTATGQAAFTASWTASADL